jgi:D-psicose/D-tagatose/L-ribulose 3-epimerase
MGDSGLTNQLGIHCLVWAGGTSRAEVERAVGQTAAAGYDLLEFSLHDMDNLDVDHARGLLEEAGLAVSCSRGLAFDADVSSTDPVVVERGAQLLQASLATAAKLGAKVFTGAPYSALGKYPGPSTPEGRANAIAVVKSLAQEARGLGMGIGLEVINRYETNVINTAADAIRFADAVAEDNVFIHLDTYHMNIEEDDMVRPVHLVGERLGYVHVSENHRGYLGSGHIDFTSFFHALADVGFGGPITYESFSSTVVAEDLSNNLAVWRDMWDDGEDLARHAHRYMSVLLAAV